MFIYIYYILYNVHYIVYKSCFRYLILATFRMTRLLLLVAGLAVAAEGRRIQTSGEEVESLVEREGRGLADWFGWGASQPTEAPVRRIQGLQRRISQVEVS